MSNSNFIITEYPKDKFYKDEGGKNAHLSFKINFLGKIFFTKNDIKINIYSGDQLIEFKDNKEKQLLFQLIDLKINYKESTLHIKFRINKVSRRFDNKSYIIKILSKYFMTIESLPINVLSKNKKRKRCCESNNPNKKDIISLEKKIKNLEDKCKISDERIKKLENAIDYINDYIIIETLPSDVFTDSLLFK